MSSIVKAKLLTEVTNSMDYISQPANENMGQENETINVVETSTQQDSMISQAIMKSQHIESEAQKRADALVDSALKSSREIMTSAEKKGYEEGYLRGLVDGASASENAAEEGLNELKKLIEAMNKERKEAVQREEKDLIVIAFEIAKKIMKQHVHADEDAVLKMLEEIISESESSLKIYLSEYQKTLDVHIDKAIAKKIKALSKNAKLVLVKDDDLLMAETETGIEDMSLPVQLEQLKKAVDHAS